MTIASMAGRVPMTNIHRQALPIEPVCSTCPSTIAIIAAVMLPTADSAWSQPERAGAGAVGHDLGHQGHADGELAADAQAGEEPVEHEVPDPSRGRSAR